MPETERLEVAISRDLKRKVDRDERPNDDVLTEALEGFYDLPEEARETIYEQLGY